MRPAALPHCQAERCIAVTDTLQIIRAKLIHLPKTQAYLAYSHSQVVKILPLWDWASLTPAQHESLAAFRLTSYYAKAHGLDT